MSALCQPRHPGRGSGLESDSLAEPAQLTSFAMTREKDYVLGTHDEEIERLGLQHRIWRSKATDAWQRADFTVGQTLLDVGCGPGYATLDLAEIVGPAGRVVGVDRAPFFELSRVSARAGRHPERRDGRDGPGRCRARLTATGEL